MIGVPKEVRGHQSPLAPNFPHKEAVVILVPEYRDEVPSVETQLHLSGNQQNITVLTQFHLNGNMENITALLNSTPPEWEQRK